MCMYPLQQHKHKHLPTTSPSMKPSKDTRTLVSYIPIGIPSTSPINVPRTLPSQKPSSHPTFVPSSNITTHPSQSPIKPPSKLPSIVPSLEHYNNIRGSQFTTFICSELNSIHGSNKPLCCIQNLRIKLINSI